MWTDIWWNCKGAWISNSDKTMTTLIPLLAPNLEWKDTKELTEKYYNIQNKFSDKDFLAKYKFGDYLKYVKIGAFWINTFRDDRTIYIIDDIINISDTTPKTVVKKNVLTGEVINTKLHKFLNNHMPLGLFYDKNPKDIVYYKDIYEPTINIPPTNKDEYDKNVEYVKSVIGDILEDSDVESAIITTIATDGSCEIAVSTTPTPITEPVNPNLTEEAVITIKAFNDKLFELGKAYKLIYKDTNASYQEIHEALLITKGSTELIFTMWDNDKNALCPFPLYIDSLYDAERGDGWEIWKMG